MLFFLFAFMLEQMMFRSTSLNMALEYQGDDHVLAGTLPHLASLDLFFWGCLKDQVYDLLLPATLFTFK